MAEIDRRLGPPVLGADGLWRHPFNSEVISEEMKKAGGANVWDPESLAWVPYDGVNRSRGPHSLAEAAAMPSTQRVNHGWAPRDGANQRAEDQDRAEGTVVVIGPKTDEAGELTVPPGSWTVVRGVYVGPTGRWQMDLVPAAPEPKRKGPWRSKEYLAFVRSKRCAWCNAPAPSEASHHGKHGIGTKAEDHRCIPLCAMCHRGEYHRTGALGRMTPEQTREWAMDRALETIGEWVAR